MFFVPGEFFFPRCFNTTICVLHSKFGTNSIVENFRGIYMSIIAIINKKGHMMFAISEQMKIKGSKTTVLV